MFIRSIFLLAVLLAPASVIAAGDHLEPEDSIFSHPQRRDDYYWNVIDVLKEAYGDNVVARAVVIPAFQNEFAVALVRDGDSYKILHVVSDYHIWRIEALNLYKSGYIRSYDLEGNSTSQQQIEELERDMPQSIQDIRVNRCELAIPKELGASLVDIWRRMLRRTRFPDEPIIGADGVTYHFSMKDNYQQLAGQIWSPEDNTRTGKLVAIIEEAKLACSSETEVRLKNIATRTHSLRDLLLADDAD